MLEITLVPAFSDNYHFIVHEPQAGLTAVVDPGDPDAVSKVLEAKGYQLDYILNTHHHWDHKDGNLALKRRYRCEIVGNMGDAERIPGIDIQVEPGETFALGEEKAEIYAADGHTIGQIMYYFPKSKALFSGDAIFSLGCGRLFEGTHEQAFETLQRIARLPDDTKIYCAHEYTLANIAFTESLDEAIPGLAEYKQACEAKRAAGEPTVPTTVRLEKELNPFLRAKSVEEFAELRWKKDRF